MKTLNTALMESGSEPAASMAAWAAPGSVSAAAVWPFFMTGQPEQPVRVIVIEDDIHARHVIAQELCADVRIDLMGQADSLRSGRTLIQQKEFDVMLVDLNLKDGQGLELIGPMKQAHPTAEAVVITVMDDEACAIQAFELGATGYLVKNSWFGGFAQAVLQVVNGGAFITPSLARRLLRRLRTGGAAARMGLRPDAGYASEKLSGRETEVLRLVARGHTSAEVGKRLCISELTVNTHIRNIYRKLQVRSRAQAVSRASEWGLLY